jgi:hypothetical protein
MCTGPGSARAVLHRKCRGTNMIRCPAVNVCSAVGWASCSVVPTNMKPLVSFLKPWPRHAPAFPDSAADTGPTMINHSLFSCVLLCSFRTLHPCVACFLLSRPRFGDETMSPPCLWRPDQLLLFLQCSPQLLHLVCLLCPLPLPAVRYLQLPLLAVFLPPGSQLSSCIPSLFLLGVLLGLPPRVDRSFTRCPLWVG